MILIPQLFTETLHDGDSLGRDPLGDDGTARGSTDLYTPSQYARRAESTFFRPIRFLSAIEQESLVAIQAFCREIAAIADAQTTSAWKQAALSNWRGEMARLFAGDPRHPISQALLEPIGRHRLRCEDFLAIIEGTAMEVHGDIRAPHEAELDFWMQRGTVAVAHLALNIAGTSNQAARRIAAELGRALALTDILLGLADDAVHQRLYLPRELLRANGIYATLPSAVLADPVLPVVCRELALRADRHYVAAHAALSEHSSAKLRSAAFVLHTQRAILRTLVARDWRRLGEPVDLSSKYETMLTLRLSLFGQ
jgi:phytoene synthase